MNTPLASVVAEKLAAIEERSDHTGDFGTAQIGQIALIATAAVTTLEERVQQIAEAVEKSGIDLGQDWASLSRKRLEQALTD